MLSVHCENKYMHKAYAKQIWCKQCWIQIFKKMYIGFSNVLWGQNLLDITDTQCNIICSFAFYEDHICGALNIHSQLQCIHNAS